MRKIFVILVTLLSLLIFAKTLFNISISPINNEHDCVTILIDNNDDLDSC